MVDVLVCGSGPAGWALAARCARAGLHTAIVAPRPRRPWPATYGLWCDEVDSLPPGVTAARPATMRAVTTRAHRVTRGYAIVDNSRLLAALAGGDVEVITGRVVAVRGGRRGCLVRLAGGGTITPAVVVDATGARRALVGGTPNGPRAEQTAAGVVVPAGLAAPILGADEAVFMDWSPIPGQPALSTFLYAMPLGHDRVLLEETSLAARPGLPISVLSDRLQARLAAHGVPATAVLGTERVRFPLDLPPPRPWHRPQGIVQFGTSAGMIHPATGYGVSEAFALAGPVAAALAAELPRRPARAVAAARHVVWPPAARMARLLRRRGLAALLSLPPHQMRSFFTLFFELPETLQRAYLSGRDDPAGTAAAMAILFRRAPGSLRARIATGVSWYAPMR